MREIFRRIKIYITSHRSLTSTKKYYLLNGWCVSSWWCTTSNLFLYYGKDLENWIFLRDFWNKRFHGKIKSLLISNTPQRYYPSLNTFKYKQGNDTIKTIWISSILHCQKIIYSPLSTCSGVYNKIHTSHFTGFYDINFFCYIGFSLTITLRIYFYFENYPVCNN